MSSTFATDGKLCIERSLELGRNEKDFNNIISRYDIAQTCNWITSNNYVKVCLQFPDELLFISSIIYEEIKKRIDVDLYILGDTSYSSCCVDSVAAMHVQGEAVVHYGHTCLTKTNIPVFMVLPKKDLIVENIVKILKENFNASAKICLFYDTDYQHCADTISEHWFGNYPNSYIAYIVLENNSNKIFGRVIKNKNGEEFPVEVLKDYICVNIGSRGQTVFNYTISIEVKEWYLLDIETSKVERLEETAWLKRRRYLVEKCKDAGVIGILICKLAGEQTKDIISRMKQLCKVNGKKSYIISVGKPNIAKLANFPEIDIYVMIACPENELYISSTKDFYKPIVYPYELEVALNSNREPYFTTHVTDYDLLLAGRKYHCEINHMKETDVSLVTGKIRETRINPHEGRSTDLVEKQNWALEMIGQNLQQRSWKGLEQKLGETEIKKTEEGRKGIPLQYNNEPK